MSSKTLASKTLLHRLLSSSPVSGHLLFLVHYLSSTSAATFHAEDPLRRKVPVPASATSLASPHAHFSSSASSWRHQDEESRLVKVSVWWDIENCGIPVGVNPYRIPQRIVAALRSNGIKGPVSIAAFGDITRLPCANQEALSTTGVCLYHVPNSGKNSADRCLVLDLIQWTFQNPPPAHIFLISGDKDFSNVLHRLRMSNYNILLASSDGRNSGVLCSAASIMWQWNKLVRGDALPGKHINYPPDGLHGSWYGHYKGPLEDPFLDVEAEDSLERGQESKVRPIPKALVKQIQQILSSYPDGLRISTLRQELAKSNLLVDKDFFGYKKFSRLLSALPHMFKIQLDSSLEGQDMVFSVQSKCCELESSQKSSTLVKSTNGQSDLHTADRDGPLTIKEKLKAVKQDSELKKTPEMRDVDSPSICQPTHSSYKGSNMAPETSQQEKKQSICPPTHSSYKGCNMAPEISQQETKQCLLSDEDINSQIHNMCTETSQQKEERFVQRYEDMNSEIPVEKGFFRKIWKTWFGREHDRSGKTHKFSEDTEVNITSSGDDEKVNPNGLVAQSRDSFSGSCLQLSDQKSSDVEDKARSCVENDGKSNSGVDFIARLVNWCRFKKPNISELDDSIDAQQTAKTQSTRTEQVVGEGNHNKITSPVGYHELFSKTIFWDDLESFLRTHKGFAVVCRAKTRQQLAEDLQKEGPLILKSFKAEQLSCLIDMLILEKKWVDESSRIFPFKLSLPGGNGLLSNSNGSNGLSAIFTGKSSNSSVQRLREVRRDAVPEPATPPLYGISCIKKPQNLSELKSWSIVFMADAITAEDFKKYFERDFKEKLDCSIYGFSTVEDMFEACSTSNSSCSNITRKISSRSRCEILSDCRKLLMDLFRQNPDGFNMGSFKPSFYNKYGYVLDNQMLGYPKLASLLQLMPGVKVDNTFVLPAVKVLNSDFSQKMTACDQANQNEKVNRSNVDDAVDESSGSEKDQDDHLVQDSEWAELGPISRMNGIEQSPESQLPTNLEIEERVDFDNESLFSEDDSNSEDEGPCLDGKDGEKKCESVEESSLLQILDSWYTKNGGKVNLDANQFQSVDGFIDCSRSSNLKPLELPSAESSLDGTGHLRRMMARKKYTFVSE